MVETTDGDIARDRSSNIRAVLKPETGGAVPIDVRHGFDQRGEPLGTGLDPAIGENQLRITVAVQIGRDDSAGPVRRKFGSFQGVIAAGRPPVHKSVPQARIVVNEVAENNLRVPITVQVNDNGSPASRGGKTSEVILLVHKLEHDLSQRPAAPKIRKERPVAALLVPPIDEGVSGFEDVMVVADQDVHVAIAIQVPLIHDLDASVLRHIEVGPGIARCSLSKVLEAAMRDKGFRFRIKARRCESRCTDAHDDQNEKQSATCQQVFRGHPIFLALFPF